MNKFNLSHSVKVVIELILWLILLTSGLMIYLSSAYGGKATDIEITAASELLEKLESGDIVLADKGFSYIVSILKRKLKGENY